MSNFQLNVESPYPKPEEKNFMKSSPKMNYPSNDIRFSYYGNTITSMIKKAIKMKDDQKEILTGMIANQMKKSYILFNKSSVDNNVIKQHLHQLSNGELKLSEDFVFIRSASVDKQAAKHNAKKKNLKKVK